MVITNEQLHERLLEILNNCSAKSVTGAGRSGAIAAVYASHILGIPFIPYKCKCPDKLRPILIIDTAKQSGKTLRKAEKLYIREGDVIVKWAFNEPPRVKFWYEFFWGKGKYQSQEKERKGGIWNE